MVSGLLNAFEKYSNDISEVLNIHVFEGVLSKKVVITF